MTMILGVNLSNRQYIAGDTRMSSLKDNKYVIRTDNIQKVENLPRKGMSQITIASAGDAAMAKHILNQLKKSPLSILEIAELRQRMHSWLVACVDEYFTSHGYSEVTFIIGGANHSARKQVHGETMRKLATAYVGKQGGFMYINPDLRKVIELGKQIPDGDLELEIDDMMLFGVKISQANGVEFIDSKWGDVLIYGQRAGLVKQGLKDNEIASFEFGTPNFEGETQEGRDMAYVNGIVMGSIEKYGLETVGGAVLAFQNLPNGTTIIHAGRNDMYPLDAKAKIMRGEYVAPIMSSEITVQNNHFYRVTNGTNHRLIPVSAYNPDSFTKLYL